MPGVSRCDRGDDTRVLPTHCTRGCGCNGHPAFPAASEGEEFTHNSGASRRGSAEVCLESVTSIRRLLFLPLGLRRFHPPGEIIGEAWKRRLQRLAALA